VLTPIDEIDVRTRASGDLETIEAEISEKIEVAERGARYTFHSNHSVPDNVPFSVYEKIIGRVPGHYREVTYSSSDLKPVRFVKLMGSLPEDHRQTVDS
jgi:hypothetical protein